MVHRITRSPGTLGPAQGELIESGETAAVFKGARDERTRAYLSGEFG
jgi:ABC-type phosphate transport system ATPase subunit